jgi:FkbM family methyltransferase
MKKVLKKMLNFFGLIVFKRETISRKIYPDLDRRLKIINNFEINLLLDIGANTGQYSSEIRRLGYFGEIISFEPLKDAYQDLLKVSKNDSKWSIRNLALGDKKEDNYINVSENSMSSSILKILPLHIESAPQSRYINKQKIEIDTIDSVLKDNYLDNHNVMVKIDTQGYEKKILEGAIRNIDKIRIIQLEMSIEPLYDGEINITDMIVYMKSIGFKLYSLENGHEDKLLGKLLQVDGVFVNENLI